MQKRIIWFAILLFTICNKIAAEDRVSVNDFSISPGETKQVSIMLDNEVAYVGFQFDVYLPDGFSVSACTKGDRIPDGTSVAYQQQADGCYRVIAASFMGNPITGNSGAIVTLTVAADASVASGDLTGYLRNIKVSKSDGKGLTKDEESFTITVEDGELEAYAVLSDNDDEIKKEDGTTVKGKTLTFYYDKKKADNNGLSVGPFDWINNRSWHNDRERITSVVFDNSFVNCATITSTDYWFYGCKNIASITGIENLMTDNAESMKYMFYNCSSLTSIDVSKFNTAKVWDMSYMFSGCSSLTSLNLGDINTEYVTNMNGMFYGCSSLTSIDVSKFNTTRVEYMANMFYGCSALTNLDMDNFNTSKVISMVGMFSGCSGLTSIDLSKFNTTKVTGMRDMFKGCSSLTGLNLDNFDTSNVTAMDGMFANCSGLTSLDLSKFNTANVTSMNSMFSYCSSLTSLEVNNFNTSNVTDMHLMFAGCSSLTSLDLSSFNTATVTNMSYMFLGCSNLTSLDLSKFNTDNVTGMDGMFSHCSGLTSLDVSNFNTTNVTDMNGMFNRCSSLSSLDLSSFKTTNVANMHGMFLLCSALTTIYVGDAWTTKKVTEGDTMFNGCAKLVGGNGTSYSSKHEDYTYARIDYGTDKPGYFTDKSVSEPEAYAELTENEDEIEINESTKVKGKTLTFYYDKKKKIRNNAMGVGPFSRYIDQSWYNDRKSITSIEFDRTFASCDTLKSTANWFFECSNLKSLSGLGNFKTDNVTDMSSMFELCSSLKELDLGGFKTDNVTTMAGMFDHCDSLENVNVLLFNTENVTDMFGMFSGCSSLKTLDLISFNTQKVTDMNSMFSDCTSLETIYVGLGWDTKRVTDSELMFSYCESIVGGAGTVYDSDHIDKTYARVDGGKSRPGYLSEKAPDPYAALTDNEDDVTLDDGSTVKGKTLTFYYDNYRINRNGMNVGPNGSAAAWNSEREKITKAVFDKSFNNYTELTSTYYWFANCKNLTTITDIRYLHTDNVTNMGKMFNECVSLESLDLSRFNTEKVTTMNNMFSNCSKLTELDVYGFNTSNVKNMQSMFSGCSNVTELDLRKFNTTNVTNMMAMFSGCSELTAIYAGDSWITTNVTDGADMFKGCTKLVGSAGTAFDADHADYTYAHIDGGADNPGYLSEKGPEPYAVLTYNEDDIYVNGNATRKTLTFYYDDKKADNKGMSVGPFSDSNDQSWLSSREYITSVVFDSTFANCTTIANTDYWFYGCKNLTSFTGWEYLKTDNVESMISMFDGCSSLKELVLTSFNTAKVQHMSKMFYGCSSLKTVYAGLGWETNAVTTEDGGKGMFYGCIKLVGSAGTEYVSDHTNITYAHIDGGADNPGYLSKSYPEPYAVLTDNDDDVVVNGTTVKGKTLTFYYDEKKTNKNLSVGPFSGSKDQTWRSAKELISSVAFDSTFVNYTSLTSTAYWFYECSNLTTITGIENLNTAKVTDMAGMFRGCSGLTNLDVSNFNTAKVKNMEVMFYGCSGLTSLDVSNFNTENVTYIGGLFSYCNNLSSLDVSNFNTAKVTVMSAMFAYCNNLSSLDVSNFNTAKVTEMNSMFEGCSGLTTILVGDGWTTVKVNTDGEDMFKDCTKLVGGAGTVYDANHTDYTYAHVDGGESNPGYLTDIADKKDAYAVLSDENKVLTFYYDNQKEARGGLSVGPFKKSDDQSWSNATRNITSVVFDASFAKCDTISSTAYWFNECRQLNSIKGKENLNTTNVRDMSNMFRYCTELDSIDLSNFNTASVTDMSGMFYSCYGLQKLDLSKFDTQKVTSMTYMFAGCFGLGSLDLSNFNTASVTDMSGMFSECNGLKSLDVSNFNTSKVTNMSCMYLDCSKLENINLALLNTDNVTDMSYMFLGCPCLEKLDLTSFNTAKVHNMTNMFFDCSSLTTIYVSDDWKTEKVSDGANMFMNCNKLFGGAGTAYDSLHVDVAYAHIDGGEENPGYLTQYSVTITAKDYTREYGAANPKFEYTVEGAEISGTPTITCAATDTTSVGTYPITITYTKADSESTLNVTCVEGTLTITKAPLTITAKSYTIKRGEAIPTLEATYTGFKNKETEAVLTKAPTLSTTAKSDSEAGSYDITVSGAAAKNYDIEYENGTLTITDEVTVTAKNYTRVYGEANPKFEYTSEGATLSGKPTLSCEATATSPVGTYDIVVAQGSITNREVTYVFGTLTITKAPLTITAKDYTIKQGKPLPAFEVEYSGFKNKETDTVFTTRPIVSTTATSKSEPGTYDITVSGAEANNYETTYVSGKLTITKRTENFDGVVLTVDKGGVIEDAFEYGGGKAEVAKTIAAVVWNDSTELKAEKLDGISNPNLLIYVSDEKLAPSGFNNVVINGVAKNITLTDGDTGNYNFHVPQEFKADNISYSREFKQTTQDGISRGWEGIVLPFTVQTFTHEEHGNISPFGNDACEYHFWLRQPTKDGVVSAKTIEANKPYIISMPNSEEYEPEFNQAGWIKFAAANVKVPVTETEDVWLGDSAQIAPTFLEVEKSADIYVLNVGDSIQGHPEGSIFVSNYRKVRPFEVYTFHEFSRSGSRFISLSSLFGGNNGSTDMGVVTVETHADVWYDLNGRRLQGKPTKSGLYIHNGKKEFIRP